MEKNSQLSEGGGIQEKNKKKEHSKNDSSESVVENQFPYHLFGTFRTFFIVKISGKGNIDKKDSRYQGLSKNISKSVAEIEELIRKYNKFNKEVIIIWDGDNYQGKKHEKPSPFTDIIMSLSKKKWKTPQKERPDTSMYKYMLLGLKFKNKETPPWKEKHLLTWEDMYPNTNQYQEFFYSEDQEPHIVTNKVCDMLISYGSSKFPFRDDDKSKGETSGYSHLKNFLKKYQTQKILDHPDIGFEVYLKESSLKNKVSYKDIKKKKKITQKKNNLFSLF